MQRRSCGDVTLLRVTTQARAFHLWGMFLPWVIQFVILLFARIRVWCNFRGTGGVLSTYSPLLILPVLPRLLKTCSDFIMNCFRTTLPVKVKHLYRIVQCWPNVEDVWPTLHICYTSVSRSRTTLQLKMKVCTALLKKRYGILSIRSEPLTSVSALVSVADNWQTLDYNKKTFDMFIERAWYRVNPIATIPCVQLIWLRLHTSQVNIHSFFWTSSIVCGFWILMWNRDIANQDISQSLINLLLHSGAQFYRGGLVMYIPTFKALSCGVR